MLSLIEGPEDLETEVGVSLVGEYEMPTNRSLMHIPDIFPQGVPHVRYQRLVTIHPGYNKAEQAQTLWEAGKLVLKHVHTEQRVRFGTWSQDTDKGINETGIPALEDNEIWMDVPIGTPESSIRRYAALFGSFTTVNHRPMLGGKERTGYKVQYVNKDSAVVAHGLTLESVLGEIHVTGREQPTELANMKKSIKPPEGMENQHDEDWWRFEIGRLMGAEKATEQEDNRLSAANLSRLMAEQAGMLQ